MALYSGYQSPRVIHAGAMKKCALYRVVHLESGRDYVGISVNYQRRWAEHRRAALNESQLAFHRALRKYGPESFSWKVIALASCFSGGITLEKMARHLGLGYYNLTEGGEGASGVIWSKESRQKLSAYRTGKLMTTEAKAKISVALVGNDRRKGKPASVETKAKMSAARKGRPAWNRGRKVPRKVSPTCKVPH